MADFRFRVGSLCTGYGGIELALENLIPAELAFVADIDKGANLILKHRFPGIPNLGDLIEVDWEAWTGQIDILTAGFPCQDLSQAGARRGLHDGDRSGNTWLGVVNAIATVRPRMVLLENVAGLLTGGDWVDDPLVRCVCGWPYRRGRLHLDQSDTSWLSVTDGDGGDDESGSSDPGWAESEVRRFDQLAQSGQGEVGCSVCVESDWNERDADASEGVAASGAEGRTGAAGNPASGNQGRPSGADRSNGKLDGMFEAAMPGYPASDYGTEREGTQETGTGDVGRLSESCPACGRPVGDRPDGHVFRSWFGTLQGDLSQIGYASRWCVVRASDVGAPHRRERVFILAEPVHAESVGWWLDRGREREGREGQFERVWAAEPVAGDYAAADTGRGGVQRQRRPGTVDSADAGSGRGVGAVDWDGSADDRGRQDGPAAHPDVAAERAGAVEAGGGMVAAVAGDPESGRDRDGEHADAADPAGVGWEGVWGDSGEGAGFDRGTVWSEFDGSAGTSGNSAAADPDGTAAGQDTGRSPEPSEVRQGSGDRQGDSVRSGQRGGFAADPPEGNPDFGPAAEDSRGSAGNPERERLEGQSFASMGRSGVAAPGHLAASNSGYGDNTERSRPQGRETGEWASVGNGSGSDINWGRYEPAIRAWENIIGRPAPRPAVPSGRDGKLRLNPVFPEWMMGLPEGWVTQVPHLSRMGQLKAIGNGVCPQQAMLAFRMLLREVCDLDQVAV